MDEMNRDAKYTTTYFDDLSMRKISTWVGSGLTAVGINLTLFLLIPGLLDQEPSKKEIETLIPNVNVIRIKHPETNVKRREIKPPSPPKKKPIKISNSTPKTFLQPQLPLPFKLNPKLPGGPISLELPDLKSAPLINTTGLKTTFSEGQLDAPLTVLARIPPVYPLHAKNRGIEGWVKISFIVNTTGHVDDILILESKPEGVFNQSVIRCVNSWRFKAGKIEGMAVRTKVETIIRFELD